MLDKYFESYRASALRDLLPEFSEESRNIPIFNYSSSLYDHLQNLTKEIKDSIQYGNKKLFIQLLKEHRNSAITVQKSIVARYDNPMKHGWKSFKFSDASIEYDRFTLLPRVSLPLISGKPIVFADEMAGVTEGNADKVLEAKKRKPCYVQFLPNGGFATHSLVMLNQGLVIDWTGELKI